MNYFLMLLLFALAHHCHLLIAKKNEVITKKEEFEIPLTEDLMREHGALNRLLLIYEEIIRRIEKNIPFPPSVLTNSIAIIQSFIENYHEKLEETYIFPLFEKNKRETKLVKTLKKQHNKGREITAQLQKLSSLPPWDKAIKKSIKNLLKKFIRMYRPHEAREDTILFPQIRSLLSKQDFEELGEKFEDREHELFGENGFESIVQKIEIIEKDLNIYNLEQFTPKKIK